MSDIFQGLSISLVGMLITFGFFGLLILLIVLLRELFQPPSREVREEDEDLVTPDQSEPAQDMDRMKAAGIAVAVARLKAENEPVYGLGQTLEGPPGRWWVDARREE